MASHYSLSQRTTKTLLQLRDNPPTAEKPRTGWAPLKTYIIQRHRSDTLKSSAQDLAIYHCAASKRIEKSVGDLIGTK